MKNLIIRQFNCTDLAFYNSPINYNDDWSRDKTGLPLSQQMVYDETKNNLTSRIEPCIALRESKISGDHHFMLLKTGRRWHTNKWTQVPISKEVINIVHNLADSGDQPCLTRDSVIFKQKLGKKFTEQTIEYNEIISAQNVQDAHEEIYNRLNVAAKNVDDIPSFTESSEEISSSNDSASDSMYEPEDEAYHLDLSEVNNKDFEFEMAHTHNVVGKVCEVESEHSGDSTSLQIYHWLWSCIPDTAPIFQ